MSFDALMTRWNWKPIRNCPGRFKLVGIKRDLPPQAVLCHQTRLLEFVVENARDTVIVVPFSDGGGLISYRRADGTYAHTLNDAEGFSRKIAQLRIELASEGT